MVFIFQNEIEVERIAWSPNASFTVKIAFHTFLQRRPCHIEAAKVQRVVITEGEVAFLFIS